MFWLSDGDGDDDDDDTDSENVPPAVDDATKSRAFYVDADGWQR